VGGGEGGGGGGVGKFPNKNMTKPAKKKKLVRGTMGKKSSKYFYSPHPVFDFKKF